MKIAIIAICLMLATNGWCAEISLKNSNDHFKIIYYAGIPVADEELKFYDDYFRFLSDESKREILDLEYDERFVMGLHYQPHIALIKYDYTSVAWSGGKYGNYNQTVRNISRRFDDLMKATRKKLKRVYNRYKVFMKKDFKISEYYEEILKNRETYEEDVDRADVEKLMGE